MLRRLWRWKPLRWVFLGAAMLMLVTFLVVQRQSTEVSYGQSPAKAELPESAVGLADATVPSVEEMTALVEASPVVRLPGAIATWDEPRIQELIGDDDVRILVAPPGLDEAERKRVREVDNATVRVVGTHVTGGIYAAVPSTSQGWRDRFTVADVTGSLLTLLAELLDKPTPPDDSYRLTWREPTDSELTTVVTDLRDGGLHVAPGATLTKPPADTDAFPNGARYVALPVQPADEPLPRYGPVLAEMFPDTPIVVMYGTWIEYHGPYADDFANLATASFYSQFGERLSQYDYSQDNVLFAYLGRVTDLRYTGLFDRPLPYQPFDPLRVALPALPWLFAACVGGFLILSMRSQPISRFLPSRLRSHPGLRPPRPAGAPARLAGLSALAVEMSLLTDRSTDPALARGISKLQAARTALDQGLPDKHVRQLLTDAWDELDQAARSMGFDFFRPHHYLRNSLS